MGLIWDELNIKRQNTRLTDLEMSQMGNTDFFIFTRILSFEDMNITSAMLNYAIKQFAVVF